VGRQALMRRFLADEGGATAIEYGLIVGIMTIAIFGIAATGGALDGIYDRLSAIVIALGGSMGGGGGSAGSGS
jgi:pilus assembly protein Flp/PilA